MGNKIARTTQVSASEYYLDDLPSSYNLVLKEVLGRGRFLKSIQCKHDQGLVLVKVYFKRGDSIDLRDHQRRLSHLRQLFQTLDHPHVWPFQLWHETDKAAYLIRQYFFNNLHDRLGTRPFLNVVEKKWLAFQLLYAVKQSHENGVCHGDIKCENVLVTSWNWLYLADFASFKPTYIPHDDPSDFSFFFDTGGRRRCYLAPERFYEHGGENQVKQDAPLKPSMDIFAIGCVISELFMEGQPLFELSQLLAYRRGQYDPSQHLEKIGDFGIHDMISHMIQLDPESRLSAGSYLQNFTNVAFPDYFSPFLHHFYSCLNPLDPDTRVMVCQSAFNELREKMTRPMSPVTGNPTSSSGLYDHPPDVATSQTLSSTEDFSEKGEIGRTWDQLKLLRHIDKLVGDVDHPDPHSSTGEVSVQPGSDVQAWGGRACEGMVLIVSLLCSSVRNVRLPHLKRGAILLLQRCSLYVDDEDRLQRVVPYVISMLLDPAAIVRCSALDALCHVISLVRHFPPSDAKIFQEYILPMLSTLPEDPEESVRICHAGSVSKLALTAFGFLTRPPAPARVEDGEKQLSRLRESVAGVVQELVMGPRQTPNVRRALLRDIGKLCFFFGNRQSNDFLLPILPAFLNDRDEQLRAVFFGRIIYVCFFVGKLSVEEYLLPYIEQSLSGTIEPVMVNALDCLSILCGSRFLRKTVLLSVVSRAFPLLRCPSRWVRKSAVSFVVASSRSLGPVDSYVFISPVLLPFVRRRPASLLSESAVLSCLKPPLSQPEFHEMVSADPATAGSDMLVRQRRAWYSPPSRMPKQQLVRDRGEDLKAISNFGPFARMSTRDPIFSDKLQFSCFVSPQMGGAGGYLGDRSSSSGIPLYSSGLEKRNAGSGYYPSDSRQWFKPVGIADESITSVTGGEPGQFYGVTGDPEGEETNHFACYGNGFSGGEADGARARGGDDNSFCSAGVMGLSDFPGPSSAPDSGWRPRGVLVAHLQEHRSAVNTVSVSGDHGFFVSASDDSSVRVWDCRRLERDISFRSRLTYLLPGSRPLCAAILHGSSQVVVGALDGAIHVFSADYAGRDVGKPSEKPSGISNARRRDGHGGAVVSLAACGSGGGGRGHSVMYSTKNHGINMWDMRSGKDAWSLKADPEDGYVSATVMGGGGNWFVSGSSRGVLTLWDLRFLIPVNTWRYSATQCPIEKLCLFLPQNVSPSCVERPLVYVAAGCDDVSLWNAENWSCLQVLKTASFGEGVGPSGRPYAPERQSNKLNQNSGPVQNLKAAKYRVSVVRDYPRLSGVRAMLPLSGGDLLTAGTDLKIRRWDYHSPERSYCVCGPSVKEGMGNDDFFQTRSNYGVRVVQEVKRLAPTIKLSTGGPIDSAGCHRDSILSLASVKLSQTLLISSSRDGAIKVWK